jgi:hypothetical protein
MRLRLRTPGSIDEAITMAVRRIRTISRKYHSAANSTKNRSVVIMVPEVRVTFMSRSFIALS